MALLERVGDNHGGTEDFVIKVGQLSLGERRGGAVTDKRREVAAHDVTVGNLSESKVGDLVEGNIGSDALRQKVMCEVRQICEGQRKRKHTLLVTGTWM